MVECLYETFEHTHKAFDQAEAAGRAQVIHIPGSRINEGLQYLHKADDDTGKGDGSDMAPSQPADPSAAPSWLSVEVPVTGCAGDQVDHRVVQEKHEEEVVEQMQHWDPGGSIVGYYLGGWQAGHALDWGDCEDRQEETDQADWDWSHKHT